MTYYFCPFCGIKRYNIASLKEHIAKKHNLIALTKDEYKVFRLLTSKFSNKWFLIEDLVLESGVNSKIVRSFIARLLYHQVVIKKKFANTYYMYRYTHKPIKIFVLNY